MTKGERSALLEKVLAGEHVELEFEATTFIQRDTPNRNFVRFQPGLLATFAKSFAGQPFLMNHDSYDVRSRAGTILASKLEHNDDGSKSMRMRVKAVKSWAVEGLLDGTIDRFSIAWDRGGTPLSCSVHLSGWYECSCRLGQRLEDGRIPELLVTGTPVGTEVSGVNVPAVVGTHVGSISQLESIDDPSLLADILGRDASDSVPQPEPESMKTLALMIASLGLAPTATEEEVAAAVQANATRLAIADKVEKDRLAAEALAAEQALAAKRTADATKIEQTIIALKAAGKLLAQQDPKEAQLRAIALASIDGFDLTAAAMLGAAERVTPVGAPLPARTADPSPSPMTDAKAALAENPHIAAMLKQVGISEADFDKHGVNAREHAVLRASVR